jgi:subtilisin-like proprotein convertase family protein
MNLHLTIRHAGRMFALLLPTLPAAATTLWTQSWTTGIAIPDYSDRGVTDTRILSGTRITDIQSVNVSLDLSGGWNGDLYAYLAHDSGFAVLLNRVGRTSANPDGSASSGMNIVLGDSLGPDIHTAIPSSGLVTGMFAPDGRRTDPWLVLDSDARPALLSSFAGLSAEGAWTLFLADQATGDTSTFHGWGLSITGTYSPGVAVAASGLDLSPSFLWELGTNPGDTASGTRGVHYGAVDVTGALSGGGAVFHISLDGDQSFADSFWLDSHVWSDIFLDGNGDSLAFENLFSSFHYSNQTGLLDPVEYGTFTISGSNLHWTPIPEISHSLIGLLLLAGATARRRRIQAKSDSVPMP